MIGLDSVTHSGTVLAADYSIEYMGTQHMPYVYFVVVCMVVFVVGIPLSVLVALKRNKQWLYKNAASTEEHCQRHAEVVDEFGTLYLQYEPQYWYWEVTVILQKMLLTGAMTIVAPGKRYCQYILLLFVVVVLFIADVLTTFRILGPNRHSFASRNCVHVVGFETGSVCRQRGRFVVLFYQCANNVDVVGRSVVDDGRPQVSHVRN